MMQLYKSQINGILKDWTEEINDMHEMAVSPHKYSQDVVTPIDDIISDFEKLVKHLKYIKENI